MRKIVSENKWNKKQTNETTLLVRAIAQTRSSSPDQVFRASSPKLRNLSGDFMNRGSIIIFWYLNFVDNIGINQ